MNLTQINRLSRPKQGVYNIHSTRYKIDNQNHSVETNKRKYRKDELIDISNRLSRHQQTSIGYDSIKSSNNNSIKCEDELNRINLRVSRPLNRHPSPTPARGTQKTLVEMENFLNRMSTPKHKKEREINRKVHIERNKKLTNKDINSLCSRLSDPRYARTRTPDTRRLLDRTFSPVNTYAWQGVAHNYVDWKIVSPYSMEIPEKAESPIVP
uniref:Uncharacterized protein n=1 Tax=Clytia hemisphaerica TaxID=252671 RepID=A0A7M5UJB8_9CNID